MRLEVTAGSPTDEEVAAVTAVLVGIASATAAPASDARAPAWARAARYEGTGQHMPFTSALDPRLH